MAEPSFIRYILPGTKAGKTAYGMWLGGAVALALFFLAVSSGQRGGESFWSNPILTVPILFAAAGFVAGGVSALWALVAKDLAIPLWLIFLWSLFVILFITGEVWSPH